MDNGLLWLVLVLGATQLMVAYFLVGVRQQLKECRTRLQAVDQDLEGAGTLITGLQRKASYQLDQVLQLTNWKNAHATVHRDMVKDLHDHVDSVKLRAADQAVIAAHQAHPTHSRFRLRNTENTAGRAVSIYECVDCGEVHVYEGPPQ